MLSYFLIFLFFTTQKARRQNEYKTMKTKEKTSIRKTILVLSIVLFVGVLFLALNFFQLINESSDNAAIQASQRYLAAVAKFRTLYTSEVVKRVHKYGIEVTHDYKNKKKAIPLPATLSIMLGNELAQENGPGEMRLYSDYPFPWRKKKGGARDDFEKEALKALSQNPEKPFFKFQDKGEKRLLRYAIADRMRASCVSCHNTHPSTPKNDWKVGDVRGVLTIASEVPNFREAVQAKSELRSFFLVIGLLLIIFLISILVVHSIKKQERATILHAQKLQSEIDQRTETEQKLLESNQELERFAYVASHDLQEPLRMVSSYLKLLEKRYKGKLDESANEFIFFAVDGAQRMSGMISSLLEYSRVGKQKANFSEVSLDSLISKVTKNLEIRINDSNATIKFEELPTIVCDPGLMERLLQNIIGNAIKFVPKDKKPIVTLKVIEKEDQHILSISDNGIGIPKKEIENVFQIFKRLQATTDYEGTGIGLSICKKIVEVHNGKIWIESVEGESTIFFISLPKTNKVTTSVDKAA